MAEQPVIETIVVKGETLPSPVRLTFMLYETRTVVHGQMTEGEFEFKFIGRAFLRTPSEHPASRIIVSLIHDDREFIVLWDRASVHRSGNPVSLEYAEDDSTGSHIWLDHLESGSKGHASEMIGKLDLLKRVVKFKQAQRGGQRMTSEWEDYCQRWEASGFDSQKRRELRAEYVNRHAGETQTAERFDRYMRRFKRKRTQSP